MLEGSEGLNDALLTGIRTPNESVAAIANIESLAALSCLDSILAVEGLDAVLGKSHNHLGLLLSLSLSISISVSLSLPFSLCRSLSLSLSFPISGIFIALVIFSLLLVTFLRTKLDHMIFPSAWACLVSGHIMTSTLPSMPSSLKYV